VSGGAWFRRRRTAGEGRDLAALVAEGFIAIDVETTGLDPRRDRVVAVAAIPFVRGVPGDGFATLVDPGCAIPPAATAIHGITDTMVAGAPAMTSVVERLDGLLGDHVLVGHGAAFDTTVLDAAWRARRLGRLENAVLDTQGLASALYPEWPDATLETVARRLGVEVVARHTAEGDALTAGRLLLALLPALAGRGIRTLADGLRFQRSGTRPF
jgi:DNA polymerase-3 subunit epsilon